MQIELTPYVLAFKKKSCKLKQASNNVRSEKMGLPVQIGTGRSSYGLQPISLASELELVQLVHSHLELGVRLRVFYIQRRDKPPGKITVCTHFASMLHSFFTSSLPQRISRRDSLHNDSISKDSK